MSKELNLRLIYYVYILFDWMGIPRYVGKGHGNRWNGHEKSSDPNNQMKNEFIEHTWMMLGEIPKIKIVENVSEAEAFRIEGIFIKAIGRFPNGPLVNLTDKRNGPSSERITRWHASRTKEERSASGRKSAEGRAKNATPEELSERARRAALSGGIEALSQRMRNWQANRTVDQRRESAKLGGSAPHKPSSMTPEERSEASRKAIRSQTKEQLSATGRKRNTFITPATRSLIGQKRAAKMTPEQRIENGRKGLAARNATSEELSAAGKKGGQAYADKPEEFRKDVGRRAAETRRARGISTPTKGSKWITNGTERRRLMNNDPLPEGWQYGQKFIDPEKPAPPQ